MTPPSKAAKAAAEKADKEAAAKAAANKATAAKAAAPAPGGKAKRKRTFLTPEQKIAQLEAELKATREKASERSDKEIKELLEKRASLSSRRDGLQLKIDEVTATLNKLGWTDPVEDDGDADVETDGPDASANGTAPEAPDLSPIAG